VKRIHTRPQNDIHTSTGHRSIVQITPPTFGGMASFSTAPDCRNQLPVSCPSINTPRTLGVHGQSYAFAKDKSELTVWNLEQPDGATPPFLVYALHTMGMRERSSWAEVSGVPSTTTHGVHWWGGCRLLVNTAMLCIKGFPSSVLPSAGLLPAQVEMVGQSRPPLVAQFCATEATPAFPESSMQSKKAHHIGVFIASPLLLLLCSMAQASYMLPMHSLFPC